MYEQENLRNKPEFVDHVAENIVQTNSRDVLFDNIAGPLPGWSSYKFHQLDPVPLFPILLYKPPSRFKQVKSYLDYYAGRIAWFVIAGVLIYEGIRMAAALGINQP